MRPADPSSHPPRYLLVSHVPFAPASNPKQFKVGDLWLEDLRAQAGAIEAAGLRLTVAAPLAPRFDATQSGSFNAVEITPAEHHFDYVPLPFYISMRTYVAVNGELTARLAEAIAGAEIVQAGYGGHPVALGQAAWPIAKHLGKKRVWIFDGADPFPRLQLHADQQANPLKRWLKHYALRRFEQFCQEAVRDADLVFAHNAAVVERFKHVWNSRCFQFDRSFVTDSILISTSELEERQRRLLDTTSPLKLLVAGRQIAIKGTDHVLRAMRVAIDAGAKLELNVLGDGEDLPRFKALCSELDLDNVVTFSGTVAYGKPLFDAWTHSHVMVITNLTAEISRNVLLAMARGLPLIMYSNAGSDDLLRESAAGWIVPNGDINELGSALVRAAQDRQSLTALAARGLALAQTKTLDATHRQRAELAARLLFAPTGRPVAPPKAA